MATAEQSMGLFDHIKELRQRLFRAIIAWIVGIIVASAFADTLVVWLARPMQRAEVDLIVLSPLEAPIIYFKIAVAAGFAIALPYILYQIYGFVAPGLYPNERSIVLLGIPAVAIFFLLGTIFTLEIMIPMSLPVLMTFFGDVVRPTYSLERYLSYVTTLVTWMGLLFQTPVVVYVVARIGLLTPKQLASARRIVWFGAAVLAAVVTETTDPVTMMLVTVPFIVLYEIGILLSHVAARQRRKAAAERD